MSGQCSTDAGFAFASALCGQCAPDHVRFKDTCVACPDKAVGLTASVAIYLFVSVGLYMLMTNDSSDALSSEAETREVALKILATYASTMGSVGDLKARGPAFLRTMVGWARPVSGGLSLGFYPIKCALGLSFYAQTWGTVALPVLLVLTYCVFELFVKLWKRYTLSQLRVDWMACTVIVLYYMYPPIVRTLLSGKHFFQYCLFLLLTIVTACHDTAVEGSTYLVADFSLSCFDYSHVVSLVSSICVLGLLGMGLPAFIFFKTRKLVDVESKFHFFCGK